MKKPAKNARRLLDIKSRKQLVALRQRIAELKTAKAQRRQVEKALRASEERYRVLVETAPDVVYIVSEKGVFASLNPAFDAITGWARTEWMGKSFAPLVHPEDLPLALEMFQKVLQGGTPSPFELRILSKSGKYLVGEFTATPYIKDGKVVGNIGIVRNITERKQAEEALRESTSQMESAIEAAKMGVWRADLTTQKLINFKTSGPISELPPDEAPTNQEEFLALVHPEDRPRVAQHLSEAVEKTGQYQLEFRIVRRNGVIRWVHAQGQVFHDENGRPTFMTGVDLDITERKLAEEELRASEARFRIFVDHASDAFFLHDERGVILDVNQIACTSLGYSREELIGMLPRQFDPDMSLTTVKRISEQLNAGEVITIERRHRRKDGTVFPVEVRSGPFWQNGKLYSISLVRDITERKRAEEEFRLRESYLTAILENQPGLVWLKDKDSRFLTVNQAFADSCGKKSAEELINKTDLDIWPKELAEKYRADDASVMKNMTSIIVEELVFDRGETKWFETFKTPIFDKNREVIGTSGYARDITERKRAEESREQSVSVLQATLESTADGILVVDNKETIVGYNERFIQLWHIPKTMIAPRNDPPVLAFVTSQLKDPEKFLAKVKRLYAQPESEDFDVLELKDGRTFERYSIPQRVEGRPVGRVWSFRDVTERKRAELNQHLTAEILRVLNRGGDMHFLIKEALRLIREATGFDAVGLRMRQGDDYPYYEQNGFSNAFLQEENFLCARGENGAIARDATGRVVLECICGLVLSGRTDPSMSCFTAGGSFWSNASSELLALAPKADPRTNPRNRCIHSGYKSIALIPLRSGEEILGLLQLNDRRERRFTTESIRFFEGLTDSIGIAFKRKQIEKSLRVEKERLERASMAGNIALWEWDMATGRLEWSPTVDSMLGYEPGAFPRTLQMWEKTIHPDDLGLESRILAKHFEENAPYDVEYRVRRKDGSYIWWHDMGACQRDKQGKVYQMSGVCIDVTERKLADEALTNEKLLLRTLVDHLPLAVWLKDAAGRKTLANRLELEYMGATSEAEVLGKTDFDFYPKEQAAIYQAFDQEMIRTGRPLINHEASFTKPDGSVLQLMASVVPVRDAAGRVTGLVGVNLDITERKRAEEELKRTHLRLEQSFRFTEVLFSAIPTPVFYKDKEGRYLGCNRAFSEMMGVTSEEMKGKTVYELWPGEHAVEYHRKDLELMNNPARQIYEFKVRDKDGVDHPVIYGKNVFRDENDQVAGIVGAFLDITELKQMEEYVLKLSSLKQQLLGPGSIKEKFKLITDGVVEIFGADFARIWLTRKADLCEEGCQHAAVTEGPDVCRNRTHCLHLVASSGRYTQIDGSHRRVPFGCYKIGRVASGEDVGFVTNDVTTDPRVHDHEWAKSLGLVAFAGFRLVSREGKPTGVLALFSKHAITSNIERLLEDLANTTSQVIITGSAEEERHKLEAQIQHSQRLESLGILAGGVAHDFNNLLTTILGNTGLALEDLPAVSPARESLKEIEAASHTAAELCRQMLAYSGRGQFVMKPINLSSLTQELVHLLQVSIFKKVLLQCRLADDLPAIEADPSQVRQVVMNLVINASEAIGNKEGIITISTGTLLCDQSYLLENYFTEPPSPGTYVFLEILDTGCGMNAETRAKIFDPFFTTKFTGRGLGLAAVLGIMRQHKGAIKVASEPGNGTTFTVLFPVSTKTASQPQPDAAPELWHGSGTIMVVDDEAQVRNVTRMILEHSGFRVLTANDGHEAIKLLQEHGSIIACVLLDLTMPRMDGEETYRELRRISSDVPVIMTSGYSEQEVAKHFTGQDPPEFIEKPFEPSVLLAKLRGAINKAKSRSSAK